MKRISLIAAFAAGALALTACGSDPGGSNEEPPEPADTDISASITFALWDENQVPALNENIARFNEIYPGIDVTVDLTPWNQYWTKLQTQAEGDELPDVFWINGPNFQRYAANDLLAPITSLIEDGDLDPANYPEMLNEMYSYDGVAYGVPKDYTTVAMFYNADIFERAGVDLPTSDWTWDDFASAANTISTELADEGIYGVATATSGQSAFYNTILQAGGHVISEDGTTSGYDDPASIEGIQFWVDLMADGSSPTIEQLVDTTPNRWFTSGRSAMFWAGTWVVAEIAGSEVREHTNLVHLPTGQQRGTTILGLAHVVSSGSANLPAALAFAEFLGSEDAQRLEAEMGAANPAYEGTQQAFVDSVPEWDLQVFLEAAEYADAYPISYNTAAWNAVEGEQLPLALNGERSAQEVGTEIATRMNEILAAE